MEACRRASALAAMPSITPNILQSPLMIRQRIVIIFGGGGNVRSKEERIVDPTRYCTCFRFCFKWWTMPNHLVGWLSNSRNEDCLPPFLSLSLHPMVARWQNLIPSFPWIVPGWRAWGAQGIKVCHLATLESERGGSRTPRCENN